MVTLLRSQLAYPSWTARAHAHTAQVGSWADDFLKRRSVGIVHPVHDFLFTYYNCSPLKLKQWVPSCEEELVVSDHFREEYPWLNDYWFQVDENVLRHRTERFNENIRGLAKFITELCEGILQRAPRFGCFGLHEWAMVYKLPSQDLRHKNQPLRLSQKDVSAFVESQSICCSHYDAYRFFTLEALPLNTLKPQLETRKEMEQGGCVHANMDIYKWAVKLWPWIGSDFIAKAFRLALECRELDMRASPYDLTEVGYLPICIENEEGRNQYMTEQQLLAKRSIPLRQELQAFCKRFSEFF